MPTPWGEIRPCLGEDGSDGDFDRHYVYHPSWAAEILASRHPARHVDCSSLLQFAAIVSAIVHVDLCLFRPLSLHLKNVSQVSGDLTALPFASGSVASLSSMHVVEHVGLGRYGDSLDVFGDLKAIAELKRVLAPGGDLLFVVPMGAARVVFNAHRVYRHGQVLAYFSDLELIEFALIPDTSADGGLVRNPPQVLIDRQSYGCGCFWFRKPAAVAAKGSAA